MNDNDLRLIVLLTPIAIPLLFLTVRLYAALYAATLGHGVPMFPASVAANAFAKGVR